MQKGCSDFEGDQTSTPIYVDSVQHSRGIASKVNKYPYLQCPPPPSSLKIYLGMSPAVHPLCCHALCQLLCVITVTEIVPSKGSSCYISSTSLMVLLGHKQGQVGEQAANHRTHSMLQGATGSPVLNPKFYSKQLRAENSEWSSYGIILTVLSAKEHILFIPIFAHYTHKNR